MATTTPQMRNGRDISRDDGGLAHCRWRSLYALIADLGSGMREGTCQMVSEQCEIASGKAVDCGSLMEEVKVKDWR